MFMLVPGGGVEPPRAEARRILSRVGQIWKPFKRNGFRNLRASTTLDWCSYVRFHRVRSGTFVAQSGGLNSKRKTSTGLNPLHTTSSSILDLLTPAPPSPAAISAAHWRSPKAGALPHFQPVCRTAQIRSVPGSSFPNRRFRESRRSTPANLPACAHGVFH